MTQVLDLVYHVCRERKFEFKFAISGESIVKELREEKEL